MAALERKKRLEQLDDLLDSAQEPIFVLDNNWNYIFANRNHYKNLNAEPGFLIGKNFWKVNPEVIGTQVEYHLRKAVKEGRPSHGRLMGVYVPAWFDFSAYPTPYGVSVFSYDITEEVKAEQTLQLALAQMRFYVDSNLIGVVIGDENGQLIEVNDYYLNLLGYTRDEFNAGAIDWRRITPPEHIPADEKAIQEMREQGICSPYEKEYYRKDGSRVWVYLRDALLPDGKLGAIVLDITEIRRLEAQNIEAKTNLEVQHRLVEQREQERQMIARDIHDGPIQSLVSTVFNIQLAKEALQDPKMKAELNRIGMGVKNAIQELRYVVNDLRPPAVLHVGLSRMIRMHCTDFMEKHPEIEVDHELADDRGKLLENTCLTLYRIYQEAMNNIVRHANATHIDITFSIEEYQAILEIKDNGKGFPGSPDLISQTKKGHYGLAGMKERAEAADGEIQIRSTPENGTSIWVTVPIDTSSQR